MRRRVILLAALALAPAATGCLTLFPEEDRPLQVEGPTRGYSPTASYLKVHVDTAEGRRVLVDFDRREWHVAELARRLDGHQITFLYVEGPPRLVGEVLAGTVYDPEDVESLRYASMSVSEEERLRMDAEYDALLARFVDEVPAPAPVVPAAQPVALPPQG
jgi:hypothetical protein